MSYDAYYSIVAAVLKFASNNTDHFFDIYYASGSLKGCAFFVQRGQLILLHLVKTKVTNYDTFHPRDKNISRGQTYAGEMQQPQLSIDC